MTAVKRSRGRAPVQKREEISCAEAETRLALSRKQIERQLEAGMPGERRSGRIVIFWPDARIWRDEHIRETTLREKALGGPGNANDAKKRKLDAEAELAEIEVAKARGEVVPVEEATRWFEGVCTRVRGKLLGLIPRLATASVGHSTPREAQVALQPIVHEVMDELHRGDDVPIMDEDDDAPDIEESPGVRG